MRALVFDGQPRLTRDYVTPTPGPTEPLLRVCEAGVCNTDLEIVRGYMDFRGVLGHEFVAVVEGGEMDGMRVVGEINAACGSCAACRRRMPTHCPNRTTVGIFGRNGAFADYLTLPFVNLHPVPDSVSDDAAVFVEPLAAALQVVECQTIRPTDQVVVLGDGKLGLLVAQVLKLTGCDLTLVGHHDRKRALAESWGIPTASDDEIAANSVDVIVECSGHAGGFASALAMVRPRGVIVAKSTFHGVAEIDMMRIVVDEVRVVGSRCGPFASALRLLESGLVDVASMIDARYSLNQGVEALDRAADREMLKVLIEVS